MLTFVIVDYHVESESIEANDVEDQTPSSWTEKAPFLRKYSSQRGACPFEVATVPGDPEGHLSGLRVDSDLLQETDEVG